MKRKQIQELRKIGRQCIPECHNRMSQNTMKHKKTIRNISKNKKKGHNIFKTFKKPKKRPQKHESDDSKHLYIGKPLR